MGRPSREPGASSRPFLPSHRDRPRAWLRYSLFQIPELALVTALLAFAAERSWLTNGAALGVLGVWILKDVVLYRFVRIAYAAGDGHFPLDPRGRIGVAPDGLSDEGYVRIGPERWRCRRSPASGPIAPGGAVRVVGLDGLTLEVEAWPTEAGRDAWRSQETP